MKNNLFFIVLFAITIVLCFSLAMNCKSIAKAEKDTGSQNPNQTPVQNQNQNQNQNWTQTPGPMQEREREQEREQQGIEGIEGVDNPSPADTAGEDRSDEDLAGRNRKANIEQHKSAVADFVQGLLGVANREKSGIGEQIRVIAQEQNQVRETVIEAMEKVQNRNRIKTFLIGSDYKNLGQLRSEMTQTKNRLEQTARLIERIKNEADKTELQEQIQNLEQERTRIENFIRENEGKFNLFGWFVRLFNK